MIEVSTGSTKTSPLPLKCLVISCANFVTPGKRSVKFFKFPSEIENRSLTQRWKEKCGVAADHDTRLSKVCSIHFDNDSYLNRTKTRLKPTAIPKLNLDWMFGAPEIRVKTVENDVKDLNRYPSSADIKLINYKKIVETVDENERLKQQLNKLETELQPISEQLAVYDGKIKGIQQELERFNQFCWNRNDKTLRRCETNIFLNKIFSPAQIDFLIGKKKKIYWSHDDLAMAFTLRHTGGRELYLYMKNKLNYPLPSLLAVQRWAASN